jgi:Phosphotransferase enzyme family
MTRLVTTYSTIDWSTDGSLVTKTRPNAPDARRRFRNELRVNRLLLRKPFVVRTPRLVDVEVQHRRLTFEAVQGEPLGPKYPTELFEPELIGMIELARSLQDLSLPRRWLRTSDSPARLRSAQRAGLLTGTQANALLPIAEREHRRLSFAHGDLTARNVMTSPMGLTLIDWEWAGLYPKDYDLAVLWFSLVDLSGGRKRLESTIGRPSESFLLSALLIQLWHLQWFVSQPFTAKHLATRDELIARLDFNL